MTTSLASRVLAIVGGVLIVLGSILPWMSIEGGRRTLHEAGTNGDGKWTVALGAAVIAAAAIGGLVPSIVATLCSGAAGILALVNIRDPRRLADSSGPHMQVELAIGIWLVVVGAILGVVGSLAAIEGSSSSRDEAAAD